MQHYHHHSPHWCARSGGVSAEVRGAGADGVRVSGRATHCVRRVQADDGRVSVSNDARVASVASGGTVTAANWRVGRRR